MTDITADGLEGLVAAHAEYERSVSICYDEVLFEVSNRVAATGSIGKSDIGGLLFWKRLRADTTWVKALHNCPDAEVRLVTGSMYQIANDPSRDVSEAAGDSRRALCALPGFRKGDALASALILAAAPNRMAIYDRRADGGLKVLGLKLTSSPGRYRRYMGIVDDLRVQVNQRDLPWTARDIDKALFQLGR